MYKTKSIKTIGICAHSYEGGTLCFNTCCREGAAILGEHMHPPIVLSAIPMGLSMPAWNANDYHGVARYLKVGIDQLVKAGADFFICPDNTAHLVLETIIDELPIPGLHIADAVCTEIIKYNWRKVGLLGTKWTMNGTVYSNALKKYNLERMIPSMSTQELMHHAIFSELCQGIFKQETTEIFIRAIEDLKREGAECVILGCTEIPLIINAKNSPLPFLNTPGLLAKYAVEIAINEMELKKTGWIGL